MAWFCLTCAALAGPAAAADYDIGFIGLHGGIYEQLENFARPLGLRLRYFEDGPISTRQAELHTVRVLYVQHVREEDRAAYVELFQQAKQRNPELRIVVFMDKSAAFLRGLGLGKLLTDDAEAPKYYGSSNENLRRLLVYTAVKYLGRPGKIEPAQEVENRGFYHPDHAELFPTAKAFLAWRETRGPASKGQLRVLVAVHATHLMFQQPRVVEALVREAERQGAVAAGIIDGRSPDYTKEALAFRPDVMIHTCHSMDQLPFRLELDVPHLHSIFFRKQAIDQWWASPVGLATSEVAFHIIGQELIGAIEPQIGAGTKSGLGSGEALQPIPERVEHLVRRALAHARLRHVAQAEKRVAIIYYDREMGKGELMRGSSTGMHMNGPRSLVAVLEKMHAHGYRIDPLPHGEDELLGWMIQRGRQVGVWAPAELSRLVRDGSPVLIPAAAYEAWYKRRIPESRRRQLDERWGPPPGRFMVWEQRGEKFIVVPRVDLGNVILLPQPLRGEAHGREALGMQVHDKATAPPHNYVATYFWLEEQFKANAVIHFGTHGSEFFLPGKPNGQSNHDWPDIIMGAMPNFNPWIIENMVESSPVRRRVYGVLIDHLPPPIVNAGLSDELAHLHETLDRWETLEEGALKEKFAEDIVRQVRACKLDVDLRLTVPADDKLDKPALERVAEYLHKIAEETTPVSLHVFGQPPRQDLLPAYMVNILRGPFLEALEKLVDAGHGHDHFQEQAKRHNVRPMAETVLQLVLLDHKPPRDAVSMALGRPVEKLPEEIERGLKLAVKLNADFAHTTDEIDNLLRGLDGRFVPPGPGNSPIRNPNALPTGRNMYLLNPDEVPMRPSWEVGRRLAEDLVKRHKEQTGQYPTKIGFDLRSSATFRDYGVMEGQLLALMGVEPVWDERQLVNDVKLVSRQALGRPRVDVFIAAGGWYESNLPGRLNLWDKAIRLAAQADEPDNPLFQNTRKLQETLVAQGLPAPRAALLAPARIFGRAPGRESGSFVAYAVERSGDWKAREEIATQYLNGQKYVYTEGAWGESATPAYDAAIQGTHTVVRSWSDHMTSPLSSRYTWLHGGTLCLAVEHMTGKRPEYVFNDVRDPSKSGLLNAEDALRREYRVRLFNRRWLEGMMKEGYAGADQMRFLVSNSFGWEVMRPGSVGNSNWQEMKNVLVDDKLHLSLGQWFDRSNPHAYQDLTATMIEAVRKGYWKADARTTQQLAVEYARSVTRHGLSGGLRSGGNRPLDQMVRGELEKLPATEGKELLAHYAARIEQQQQLAAGEAAPGAPAATPAPAAAGATASAAPPAAGQAPPPPPPPPPHAAQPAAAAAPPQTAQPVTGFRVEGGDGQTGRSWWWLVAAAIVVLVTLGLLRRSGTPQ